MLPSVCVTEDRNDEREVEATAAHAAAITTAVAAATGARHRWCPEAAAPHPTTAGGIGRLGTDQPEAEHHQWHQNCGQQPAGPGELPSDQNNELFLRSTLL